MTLIGISGYARSGKDTIGRILVEDHGFTRHAFATALKDILQDLNPIIDGHLETVRLDAVFVADCDACEDEWPTADCWQTTDGRLEILDAATALAVAEYPAGLWDAVWDTSRGHHPQP